MPALLTLSLLALGLQNPAPPGPSAFLFDEDGLLGAVGTHSSKPMKAGAMVLGGSGRLLQGLSLVDGGKVSMDGEEKTLADCLVVSTRSFLTLGLGFGWDASLGIPIYYESLPGYPRQTTTFDAGDASLLLKSTLPISMRFLSFALFAEATAPTSSDQGVLPKELAFIPASSTFPDATSRPLGMKAPRLGLGAGTTVDLSELADGSEALIHANIQAGRALAAESRNPLGTVRVSLAAEISPVPSFRLEAEILHESLVADPSEFLDPRGQTATLGLGLGWAIGRSFSIRAGAKLAPPAWNSVQSLTLKSGSGGAGADQSLTYRIYPTASAYLSIAWQGFPMQRDTDHDGIPDSRDNCPAIPEDQDGYQDEDGCPDPDNDGDGIPDERDKCPYVAEDFDGFEDNDGCPDLDNDHDGIMDPVDRCPNDPEDKDGFQDEDGCPDPDNDQDGIPDAVDKCPNQPENINGIEDQDGCPERDQDGDGIPDSRDKCPTEKEIINFYQDDDGCPDERPEPIRDGILNGIDFEAGTSNLLPGADSILAALAVRLQAYPGTEIEIGAYLDDKAGPAAKGLTEARAASVAEALNKHGVELRRMKTIGYASAHPLTSNRTAKGRETNRRIEIRRLN